MLIIVSGEGFYHPRVIEPCLHNIGGSRASAIGSIFRLGNYKAVRNRQLPGLLAASRKSCMKQVGVVVPMQVVPGNGDCMKAEPVTHSTVSKQICCPGFSEALNIVHVFSRAQRLLQNSLLHVSCIG